jgi:hypothetical protein
MRYLIVILLLSLVGCGEYEIERRSDKKKLDQHVADLQHQAEDKQKVIDQLRNELSSRSESGRYQLIIHPELGKFHFLIDTRLGLVWNIKEDPKTRSEFFSPIPFRGGTFIPAVMNDDGEYQLPDREARGVETVVEIQDYIRQEKLRHQREQSAPVTEAIQAATPSGK